MQGFPCKKLTWSGGTATTRKCQLWHQGPQETSKPILEQIRPSRTMILYYLASVLVEPWKLRGSYVRQTCCEQQTHIIINIHNTFHLRVHVIGVETYYVPRIKILEKSLQIHFHTHSYHNIFLAFHYKTSFHVIFNLI